MRDKFKTMNKLIGNQGTKAQQDVNMSRDSETGPAIQDELIFTSESVTYPGIQSKLSCLFCKQNGERKYSGRLIPFPPS